MKALLPTFIAFLFCVLGSILTPLDAESFTVPSLVAFICALNGRMVQ